MSEGLKDDGMLPTVQNAHQGQWKAHVNERDILTEPEQSSIQRRACFEIDDILTYLVVIEPVSVELRNRDEALRY